MIITKTNLYDNGRLFLFTMPFFATVGSFGLYFIIIKLKDLSFLYKSFSFILLFLFILSFYRFTALTPYQYAYTNYLSTPKYVMGKKTRKEFKKQEKIYLSVFTQNQLIKINVNKPKIAKKRIFA